MPQELPTHSRPIFFDLYLIKFPVTAIVSIGHRVSGVLLTLFIPLLGYLLQRSLESPEAFAHTEAFLHRATGRAIVFLLVWALAHHALAGVRHLLFDVHAGTSLHAARLSAWAVLACELLIVVVALAVLR